MENRQPLSVLRRFRKHARCRRICSGQAMEHSHRAMEANLRHPKGKKKMQAAYNLAVGYEMQDSIAAALDWALKAQAEARIVDGVDKKV